jgi:hypothetical protein
LANGLVESVLPLIAHLIEASAAYQASDQPTDNDTADGGSQKIQSRLKIQLNHGLSMAGKQVAPACYMINLLAWRKDRHQSQKCAHSVIYEA